jgi:plasmid stability protein
MASILIRNLDEETKGRLRMLAAMHRRSLEAEVREILRDSVKDAPRLMPEWAVPDREAPPATSQVVPPAMDEKETIAGINRQMEKMGFGYLAIPENPPLE